MIFSGDWRQILSVIPKGTRAQVINATLKKSYLWKDVKTVNLRTNMRLSRANPIDRVHIQNHEILLKKSVKD